MTTTLEFRAERDSLLDALSTASRAVASRGGMLAVLSGLRLHVENDKLTAVGSDLDLTMQATTAVRSVTDGTCVFPRAKLAVDILRSLEPGAITITVEDSDNVKVEGGRSTFDLRALPADEYPKLPTATGTAVTLTASDFASAVEKVVPAASQDDNRPIITGVLTAHENGGLRIVATDSYRLALQDLPNVTLLGEADTPKLVPGNAYRELIRLLGKDKAGMVSITFGERDVTFGTGAFTLTSRLIEGEFPNYRGLIPSSYPNRATLPREQFAAEVARIALLAQDNTPIRLALSDTGETELLAVTQDVGKATGKVDSKYEGTDLTIAFNPVYLLQGLNACVGDEVTLETIDALKPAVLRSATADGFLYLLMPVRVS